MKIVTLSDKKACRILPASCIREALIAFTCISNGYRSIHLSYVEAYVASKTSSRLSAFTESEKPCARARTGNRVTALRARLSTMVKPQEIAIAACVASPGLGNQTAGDDVDVVASKAARGKPCLKVAPTAWRGQCGHGWRATTGDTIKATCVHRIIWPRPTLATALSKSSIFDRAAWVFDEARIVHCIFTDENEIIIIALMQMRNNRGLKRLAYIGIKAFGVNASRYRAMTF